LLIFSPHRPNEIKFSWYFDFDGEPIIDTTSNVEFEPTIQGDRFFMCSFQIQNKFYLVGGQNSNTRRQYRISSNDPLKIEQLKDLEFEFEDGRCRTYSDKEAMLCSAKGKTNPEFWARICHQFDAETGMYHRTR